MKIKNIKYAAVIASLAMTAATSHAATVLSLTLGAGSDTGFFGSSPEATLTDGFAYNPDAPTSPLPLNQGSFSGVDAGFHADKTSGTHTLNYVLTSGAITTTTANRTVYFDFYGRIANLNRDNNYTVTLLNLGVPVSTLAGQGVADAAPYHNRSTFNLATGVTFDAIRLSSAAGPDDSAAGILPNQYFTVMEVRAATVPEPSAALLGGLGMLGLLRRRR